ncbi:TetR/AcrR family transcriptional regulator [Actinocorallia sp. API 0066]|uniref:TetR/AcrR family transcriptional regulator n=1 Tax=Actinocorallia sp. API 0066 TaxID=2896846 RepID=UPI001E621412|nr:TetR/AcrR family transcriptional regulator [Actinocorallia sp. API 0066]MCD0447737.1 TetR/AcrR family transcriptional regulator [Actinocorallia sp. API 0066]
MSPSRGAATGSGAGRPRDPQIDDAVLAAALTVLDQGGYAALSLEEVARRAGTSRPAIYRRWPGRAPLALAAIATRLDVPTPPDTGCTLCDLDESLSVFLAAYRTIRPDVLTALYAECATDPDLRARYLETVVEPSRHAVARTLDRARARGDLRPDTDPAHLLDLLASLVHYRAQFGHHLTPAEATNTVETLLRGAATDYPALLAHARTTPHPAHPT